MSIFKNIKIISGGQTGVDRAALDFALKNNIECGGWCPKGRKAEDGKISLTYPLIETGSSNYTVRTEMNIDDSEATLILYLDKFDPGTTLTRKLCKELKKPFWIQKLDKQIDLKEFKPWLSKNKVQTLNFAGPRESFANGIYESTMKFLGSLQSL